VKLLSSFLRTYPATAAAAAAAGRQYLMATKKRIPD
jgi:hypothetical protein